MSLTYAETEASERLDERNTSDARLHGLWLYIARVIWIALAGTALLLFVAGVPLRFVELHQVCAEASCASNQLTPEQVRAMADRGLSIPFYAGYTLALEVLSFALSCAVGLLIFWRKSDNWMALLVALMCVLINTDDGFRTLAKLYPSWWFPVACMTYIGSVSVLLFGYLFPNGQFVPPWTRVPAVVLNVIGASYHFFPDSSISLARYPLLNGVTWIAALATALGAQIFRYRRVSSPLERQQTKWVVFGIMVMLLVGVPLGLVDGLLLPELTLPGSLVDLALSIVGTAVWLLLPLTLALVILRFRLWDVDPLLNRALVYGTLTACVVGLYVLAVGGLGALFQARGNLLIGLFATGLVAVLFQPLRDRLQRGINHLMYGRRDEPYAVLAQFGARLQETLAPDSVLPTIAQTVREALKLPYVAIALRTDDRSSGTDDQSTIEIPSSSILHPSVDAAFAVVTSAGSPVGDLLRLPLVYQHATIGTLLLTPRSPGEPFTPADLRLLTDLAHQIAVAAHAVQLTADLQRSRERLILAREEERRRLRRDLHDDLAPTLAGLALSAGTAANLVGSDPETARTLMLDLRAAIRSAVGDIRRLVYDLRPPALDEFGLIAAIRERAAPHGNGMLRDTTQGGDDPEVVFEAPDRLPPLPAAVEVAAYRIVQETLMNVRRHARARSCRIQLQLDERGLHIACTDDGIGMPTVYQPGVGLRSIQERAAELGGTCTIERLAEGGTRIAVFLPVAKGG